MITSNDEIVSLSETDYNEYNYYKYVDKIRTLINDETTVD